MKQFKLAATSALGALLVMMGRAAAADVAIPPSPRGDAETFEQVSALLGTGGTVYAIVDPGSLIDYMERAFALFGQLAESAPDAENQGDAPPIGAFLRSTFVSLGFGEIERIGLSSVPTADGRFHNRVVFQIPAERREGLIWTLLGGPNRARELAAMLPASTAAAYCGRFDLAALFDWILQRAADSGIDEFQNAVHGGLAEMKASGVDLEAMIGSLSGELGVAITLDPTVRFVLPIPLDEPIELEHPGVVVIIGVRDSTLFDWIESLIPADAPIVTQSAQGVPVRVLAEPLPSDFPLQPALAFTGTHIILASTPGLLNEVLDLRAGTVGGLTRNADYIALSGHLPAEFASFSFVSPRLTDTLVRLIHEIKAQAPPDEGLPALVDFIGGAIGRLYGLTTMTTLDGAFVYCGNSGADLYELMFQNSIWFNLFMMTGVTAPLMSNAHEMTVEIETDLNNLRQLGTLCLLYAIDNREQLPPDWSALVPNYLDEAALLYLLDNPATPFVPNSFDDAEYVYFGGGLNMNAIEEPARMIIAAERPIDHDGIGVLFADGHVRHTPFQTVEEAAEAMDWLLPAVESNHE